MWVLDVASGEAKIIGNDPWMVPQRTINQLQGQYMLVVVMADNRVEFRSVDVGERVGEDWIVTRGVRAGERVVVEGFMTLRAGMSVHPLAYVPPKQQVG